LKSYDVEDNSHALNSITKDAVLGAEKLSDYFIMMAKKVKINSLESKELKDFVNSLKGMTIEEKIKNVFESIPDFNKKELASILNISRQTIYNHIKNLKK
jgi:predicted transcriptional regulator YheO